MAHDYIVEPFTEAPKRTPAPAPPSYDVRYKPATGQKTTTKTEYTGPTPEYERPEWDEGEIRKISRKVSGPGVRRLRQQVQQVLTRHYENPNVRKMMLRSALQGYGIGLEGILSGAETQARGEYAQRYAFDVQEAALKFQAAWNMYTAGATRTTRVQQTYGTGEEEYTGPAYLNPNLGRPRDVWSYPFVRR